MGRTLAGCNLSNYCRNLNERCMPNMSKIIDMYTDYQKAMSRPTPSPQPVPIDYHPITYIDPVIVSAYPSNLVSVTPVVVSYSRSAPYSNNQNKQNFQNTQPFLNQQKQSIPSNPTKSALYTTDTRQYNNIQSQSPAPESVTPSSPSPSRAINAKLSSS